MKNLMSKFLKEERGDVVQYVIVLAVVAIILAFALPRLRDKMAGATNNTLDNINKSFGAADSTKAGATAAQSGTVPTNN